MSRAVMWYALEALSTTGPRQLEAIADLRAALKAALAEQPQPVAEVVEDHFSKQVVGIGKWASLPNGTKLYTAPPAPQPLTVEEIAKLRIDSRGEHVNFARAVWDLALQRMGVQR